jgi:hypothetical protein
MLTVSFGSASLRGEFAVDDRSAAPQDFSVYDSSRPLPVVAVSDLAPPNRALADTKRRSAFW